MTEDRNGIIWVAATPIGNAADASPRLMQALQTADVIGAEDTRRLRALCSRLGVDPVGEILALHDHNESERGAELVERAGSGQSVLIVSDAGTPTVSDPGFRVGQLAAQKGVRLSPLPGPSAALAALSVSGLPSDRFAFEGFVPRREGESRRRLEAVATDPRTLIWFESPRRTKKTLQLMAAVLGSDRPAALCRELTKTYEEVLRGPLGDLAEQVSPDIRGEITIVTGGFVGSPATLEDSANRVLELANRGMRMKDAAAEVSEETGLRKNDLYRAALELQGEANA